MDSYASETLSLLLIFVVHVAGAAWLVSRMLGDEGWSQLRDWFPGDDGTPPDDDPRGDLPDGGSPRRELPLPSAEPSTVRLREPGRLADQRPRPTRRPEHEPAPAPVPAPARRGS